MSDVEDFIYSREDPVKELMIHFHELLSGYGLVSKIRYKVPFYYQKSWICYLNPIKGKGIELAFTRGNELSNQQGLLDFKDRKQIAGIPFYSLQDLPEESLREVIVEALTLDEHIPYASKRTKK